MKVIVLAGAIAASTAFGAYAAGAQLSQAECDTLWRFTSNERIAVFSLARLLCNFSHSLGPFAKPWTSGGARSADAQFRVLVCRVPF
jgi:hypothetical protein